MTDYAWPTAPVIRARWRAYGSNSYDGPALYFRGTTGGDYLNPGIGKWSCPEDGEFVTVTEYVEATELEKRLDQIRQLEKALRKKNARLRRYKEDLRQASEKRKEAYRAGRKAECLAQAGKLRARIFRRYGGWVAYISHGAGVYIPAWKPTHAEAMKWAENKIKELANDWSHC
ncbi:hypothetical protein [Trueperella pyogenes]